MLLVKEDGLNKWFTAISALEWLFWGNGNGGKGKGADAETE